MRAKARSPSPSHSSSTPLRWLLVSSAEIEKNLVIQTREIELERKTEMQRAEQRNRATAKLYDELGLAEYEAIEAFVRWDGAMLD